MWGQMLGVQVSFLVPANRERLKKNVAGIFFYY